MPDPNPPFQPFIPQNPEPPTVQQETPAGKKRERTSKKQPSVSPSTASSTEKPKRKPRAAKVNTKAGPKFDLQTILRATSDLREADMKAFEGLLDELSQMGSPQRDRIIEALSRVFA